MSWDAYTLCNDITGCAVSKGYHQHLHHWDHHVGRRKVRQTAHIDLHCLHASSVLLADLWPRVGDHPQNSAETWEDNQHSDLHEQCEPMLNSTWAGSWLWQHATEWVNHNESKMWLSVPFLEPDRSSSTLSFCWTDCLPPGTFEFLIPVRYLEEVRRCALYRSDLSQMQKPKSFGRKDGFWWSTFYAWLGAYAELENCILYIYIFRGRPHRNQRFARLRCSSGNGVLVCQNHVSYCILFTSMDTRHWYLLLLQNAKWAQPRYLMLLA